MARRLVEAVRVGRRVWAREVQAYDDYAAPLPDTPAERAYRPVTWRENWMLLRGAFQDRHMKHKAVARLIYTPTWLLDMEALNVQRQAQEVEHLRQRELQQQLEQQALAMSNPNLGTTASSAPSDDPKDFFQQRITFARQCIQSFIRGYRDGFLEEAKKNKRLSS